MNKLKVAVLIASLCASCAYPMLYKQGELKKKKEVFYLPICALAKKPYFGMSSIFSACSSLQEASNLLSVLARTNRFYYCFEGFDTHGRGLKRICDKAKKLLEKGENPTLANKNGITPLMLAQRRGHTELITLMEEAVKEWNANH